MAPLTYSRLLTRLSALLESIPGQLPGSENAEQVKDLQQAINAGIVAVQAGLGGDKGTPKPSQLKHEVLAKVDEINARYKRQQSSPRSGSSKENPTPTTPATTTREHPATRPTSPKKTSAVNKRRIGNPATTTNAGIKKSASKRLTRSKSRLTSSTTLASIAPTVDDQEAASTLLDLFASRHSNITPSSPMRPAPAPYVAPTANMTPINTYTGFRAPRSPLPFPNRPLHQIFHANPYRRNRFGAEFLDMPANAIDHRATPEQNFLAGVQFAMQNFTASHATERCGNTDDEFAERCYEYVRIELDIKSKLELEVGEFLADQAAARVADQAARERSVGKNFWDVI